MHRLGGGFAEYETTTFPISSFLNFPDKIMRNLAHNKYMLCSISENVIYRSTYYQQYLSLNFSCPGHMTLNQIRGCSHITSAAGGGEGVRQMLTIADEGRLGKICENGTIYVILVLQCIAKTKHRSKTVH